MTQSQCEQIQGLFDESAAFEQPMRRLSLSTPYDMRGHEAIAAIYEASNGVSRAIVEA